MTLIDSTITDFGRSIGIPDLALNERGAVALEIERYGLLAVEVVGTSGDLVVVSLTQRVETPDEEAAIRVLELCHHEPPKPRQVYAALSGRGELVFSVRFDARELTLPSLTEAISLLGDLHQSVQSLMRAA